MLDMMVMKAFALPMIVIWAVIVAKLVRLGKARKPSAEMPAPSSRAVALATMAIDWVDMIAY